MTDTPSELELHAYVDDQLDAERRFAIEAYLSDHPELAARMMGELSVRTGLRLLAQDPAPLPAELLEKGTGLHRQPRQSVWRRTAALGGLSLVAGAVAFLFLLGGPPDYVDMAVASHRLAMARAGAEVRTEGRVLDPKEILATTQIALPALPADWQVTDVQLFPTEEGPALLVAVKTVQGQPLSLFALRERSSAPRMPDAVRQGDQSVAYWRRGDMSYALTGEADPNTIDQTAEFLDRSWS